MPKPQVHNGSESARWEHINWFQVFPIWEELVVAVACSARAAGMAFPQLGCLALS